MRFTLRDSDHSVTNVLQINGIGGRRERVPLGVAIRTLWRNDGCWKSMVATHGGAGRNEK